MRWLRWVPLAGLISCGDITEINPVGLPSPEAGGAPGITDASIDVPRVGDAGGLADATVPSDAGAPDALVVDTGSADVGTVADAEDDSDAVVSCDDHDPCTIDGVDGQGRCVHTPLSCVALDVCHVAGVCQPTTGECSHPFAPDGSPCDDGLSCTTSDACRAGVCNGGGPAPRQLAPLSTAQVLSRRPTLRWTAAPGATSYSVDLCGDPLCVHVLATLDAGAATALAPAAPLPVGVVFWRVRADDGCGGTSAIWEIVVGHASTLRDTLVAGAPDFNRDGRSDMAIGTGWATSFVYLGIAGGLPGAPSGKVIGGQTMAYAGDLDGDGFGDLLTGETTTPTSGGVAYVFRGGSGGLSLVSALTGPLGFGAALAGLGDVNGDGYGDIAVSGETSSFVATLYFGGPLAVTGASPSTTLAGSPAAGANDVNGDGYADVVVGDPFSDMAFVYYGGPSGVSAPTELDNPDPPRAGFGEAVAGAGDVNGDGFADILVATASTARVYLFYGAAGGIVATRPVRIDLATGAMGGVTTSIGHAGDVNGDGYADVVLGAYNGDFVQVHHGGPNGLSASPATVIGYAAGEYADVVATLGDADGDGYADVIVSPAMCVGFPVFAYRGSAAGIDGSTPMATFTAPGGEQCFGASLAR